MSTLEQSEKKDINKKYCLPENYQGHELRTTMATVSGKDYWTRKRIRYSRIYQYHVYRYAAKIIQEKKLKSLIDVGCGPASKLVRINSEIPDLSITGIDQHDAINYCKKAHSFGEWYIDDFENPDAKLPERKGDLVICADVIEHVLDPDKVLEYCKYRLNDGGYILLSTPDRVRIHGENNTKPKNIDHVREWSADEFSQYLKSRGFKVVEHLHQKGVRPGLNKLYARVLFNHFVRKNPVHLLYNQVTLIQPV